MTSVAGALAVRDHFENPVEFVERFSLGSDSLYGSPVTFTDGVVEFGVFLSCPLRSEARRFRSDCLLAS